MQNAFTIILLFAAAWAVSRLSAIVARRVMAWSDQRHRTPSGDLSAKIVELIDTHQLTFALACSML